MTTQAESTDGIDEGLRINPKRLGYVLDLYKLKNNDLLSYLTEKRKRPNREKLESIIEGKEPINLSTLKKIDKLFGKGLHFYISKRDLPEKKSSSIFFRKDSFNTELNPESIRLTNSFEGRKFEIQTLCNYIDYQPKRKLQRYSTDINPSSAAQEISAEFEKIKTGLKGFKKPKDDKDYLKNLISLMEEFNVFIFEYVEHPKKKETVHFSGFYIGPNMIVIKRQRIFRREIFTLVHEFAHYLLDKEEIDKTSDELYNDVDQIEKWCNNFVYYFLAGGYDQKIESLGNATQENNFQEKAVREIYDNTRLSASAIYTRLRIRNKITQKDYDHKIKAINDAISREISETKARQKEEREELKKLGKKPAVRPAKPIQSNLFKEIVKINYFQGNIDEARLCDLLSIKPDKLERELYHG
jgi:Zn-dependent peptidase ImmA (M78 family)